MQTKPLKQPKKSPNRLGDMREATNTSVASVMEIISIIDEVSHSTETVVAAVEKQTGQTTTLKQKMDDFLRTIRAA